MSGENQNKKKGGFEKYLNVILIALIIIVGLNRFVFSKSSQPPGGDSGGATSFLNQAKAYYIEKYNVQTDPEEIELKIQNFGCHNEIYVYENGEIVKRLSYANGEFFEIR